MKIKHLVQELSKFGMDDDIFIEVETAEINLDFNLKAYETSDIKAYDSIDLSKDGRGVILRVK